MCVPAAESGEAYGFAMNGKHMIIYGSHDVFHLRKDRAEAGYDHVAVTVVGERFAGCKRAFDACTECRINRAVGINFTVLDDKDVGDGTLVDRMDKSDRKFSAFAEKLR